MRCFIIQLNGLIIIILPDIKLFLGLLVEFSIGKFMKILFDFDMGEKVIFFIISILTIW